jgi:hypothetical protein
VFCADGALLYSSDIDDERRLIRQVPGEEAQSWLMFDQSLRPVACP